MGNNNLKAPRFDFKTVRGLGDSNLIKGFFRRHSEYKKTITARIFTNIIVAFNKQFCAAVIENRYGAELPEGLGKVQLRSYKTGSNFIDTRTLNTDNVIKARNLHTDGKTLKICYINSEKKYNFVNRDLWYFDPSKEFGRQASRAFTQDWNRYEFIDGTQGATERRAAKNKARNYAEQKAEEFLLTYDEFAF